MCQPYLVDLIQTSTKKLWSPSVDHFNKRQCNESVYKIETTWNVMKPEKATGWAQVQCFSGSHVCNLSLVARAVHLSKKKQNGVEHHRIRAASASVMKIKRNCWDSCAKNWDESDKKQQKLRSCLYVSFKSSSYIHDEQLGYLPYCCSASCIHLADAVSPETIEPSCTTQVVKDESEVSCVSQTASLINQTLVLGTQQQKNLQSFIY